MPTPNGVNYLLQSLLLLSNSPIIEQQESKVDVQSYVLIVVLSYHRQLNFIVVNTLKPHEAEPVCEYMLYLE